MKLLRHALAIFTCAVIAWLAADWWVSQYPTPIPPDIAEWANEFDPDLDRRIYFWLGGSSLLAFIWFSWSLRTRHD